MSSPLNPALIPSVAPGNLFDELTTNNQLSVRYYIKTDPVYYEIMNRPHRDNEVRSLIIAKSVDALSASLNHAVYYPFLIQPRVANGSSDTDIPVSFIWDANISLPKKWEKPRLARLIRLSGTNSEGTSGSFTGIIRLVFTANVTGSSTETAIGTVDYQIDSTLTYQRTSLAIPLSSDFPVVVGPTEFETFAGQFTLKTLNQEELAVKELYTAVAPLNTTDSNNDGLYDSPSSYEIVDAILSDPSGSYSQSVVSHGSGLFADNLLNKIPNLDSDSQAWLNSFNYPFGSSANLTSADSITIPVGLFQEFNITAPAGDASASDISGTTYPVWISRIERLDLASTQLRLWFATYNVTDASVGGTPSTETVEFATLDLVSSMQSGQIVKISPASGLLLKTGSDWGQHFGRGHVVLSGKWDGTTSEVSDFFRAFVGIVQTPADTSFNKTSTRLSSFGVSRVPKYVPTIGQSNAMLGSTSRRSTPIYPSKDNRFVTESDQGIGDKIDLEAQSGISPVEGIDRYGYTGGLCRKLVHMVIDATKQPTGANNFYETKILPRLVVLLGRQPIFGDEWYDGTRFKRYNGTAWVG